MVRLLLTRQMAQRAGMRARVRSMRCCAGWGIMSSLLEDELGIQWSLSLGSLVDAVD